VQLLGIDIGKTGGFVILNSERNAISKFPMPTLAGEIDLLALDEYLKRSAGMINKAFIEKASARPGQGVVSMFTFGRTFGMVEALVVSAGIPYQMVAPVTWTKEIFKGMSNKKDKKKDRSLLAVKRLFPEENLLATTRSTKPHLGLVDALLIAEYGLRQHEREK